MSRRPLAALAVFVLAVLGVVFVLPPDCAYACTCAMPPGSGEERSERALAKSSAVFAGRVVNIEGGLVPEEPGAKVYVRADTVSFRVSEVWKGPERETLEVTTPSEGPACGYSFSEGREYLVYAEGERMEVISCGETTLLEKASADLEALGEGERPTGGEVLSDTSGGVSAGAMVGVAGLALVASLLLVVRLVRSG